MPAKQAGQIDGKPGDYRLRWYDVDGNRRTKRGFATKSKAREWFRENVEHALGRPASINPEITLSEFIVLYLDRHAATGVREATIDTLRERLRHAERRKVGTGKYVPVFGDISLRELERMAEQIAAWRVTQPEGSRYPRMSALRQVLRAAVDWGYIRENPAVKAGKNRQPPARAIRVFTLDELDAIAVELSPRYRAVPAFAAATGLRPEEWMPLERKDIDRSAGIAYIRRTVSSGRVAEVGKTAGSIREVPLSPRALAALDEIPPRLDTPLLFATETGRLMHLDNFRYREWAPAIEAAGIPRPARIYDLRSTFASNALAAGINLFELARIMGTSVEMIERHYGALIDGAGASIAARLGAWEAQLQAQREAM